MGFLVEDLIASIKRKSFVPISQKTFQESDLIAIADEETLNSIVPMIMREREKHFKTYLDRTLINAVNRYGVPERSIANGLKAICYVDSSGNEYPPLPQVDTRDRSNYNSTSATPSVFDIEGDEIIILPTPSSPTGSLRLHHFQRPNKLALTEDCTKITAIASVGGTTTFTVNTDLTADLAVGSKVDIVSAMSPFLLWAFDVVITAITSTTVAVATTSVDNQAGTVEPQIGDYICPRGFTNIPNLPEEYHSILASKCAEMISGGMGDMKKLQIASAKSSEKEKNVSQLIQNRVEDSPQVIRSRHGWTSSLRRS